MARYSAFKYKGAYYGEVPRLPLSVEPFSAVALTYSKISLSWRKPTGDFSGIRLVRSQDGFPETQEDGVILLEQNKATNTDGTYTGSLPGDTVFIDGETNSSDIPFVSGRNVYYRMWIRTSLNTWVIGGQVELVAPKEHSSFADEFVGLETTHDKVVDLIPRVYTSKEQSPLGEPDKTSTLYSFLRAFSFTLDEELTMSDLIIPDSSFRNTPPALLQLKSLELGVDLEQSLSIQRQKRMLREAMYTYSRKGTETALETMLESVTGFAPEIRSISSNLLLSNQDSSFTGGVGFWKPSGATISVDKTVYPPTVDDEPHGVDFEHVAKVAPIGAVGYSVENGTSNPVTQGIPVKAGSTYTFSYYIKKAGTAAAVTPTIYWYDRTGTLIATDTTTATNTTTSWAKVSLTKTAPSASYTVTAVTSAGSGSLTYTLSAAHEFETTDVILVTGLGLPYDGQFTVTGVTNTTGNYTVTIAYSGAAVSLTSQSGTMTSSLVATYAAVKLGIAYADANPVYLDMVQFSLSSVTDFYEARAVEVFINPSKTNYLSNPSFELTGDPASLANWTIDAVSSTSPDSTLPYVYRGSKMLSAKAKVSAATTISSVTNTTAVKYLNRYYTFSIYTKVAENVDISDPATLKTEDLKLQVVASDGTDSITHTSSVTTVGSTWTRLTLSFYIDDTFNASTLQFTVKVIGDNTKGHYIQLDAAQLEQAFRATDYFDGSLPAEYGISWQGTANNSASHAYRNKQSKFIRMIKELENVLPSNTPYEIYTYAGREITGITL